MSIVYLYKHLVTADLRNIRFSAGNHFDLENKTNATIHIVREIQNRVSIHQQSKQILPTHHTLRQCIPGKRADGMRRSIILKRCCKA